MYNQFANKGGRLVRKNPNRTDNVSLVVHCFQKQTFFVFLIDFLHVSLPIPLKSVKCGTPSWAAAYCNGFQCVVGVIQQRLPALLSPTLSYPFRTLIAMSSIILVTLPRLFSTQWSPDIPALRVCP